MILSLTQLQKISFGNIHIEKEEEGWFCFHHFTKSQEEYYKQNIPDFYKKALSAAGQFLEFDTNSTTFRFEYKILQGSSRTWYYLDAMVDGERVLHQGEEDGQKMYTSLALSLDGKFHRIKIYFPGLSIVQIRNLFLDDGATLQYLEKERKILAFGDSITQGYDAFYPENHYLSQIANHFHAEILNQGIGGDTFNPKALDENLPFSPSFILVAYGTNDWSHQSKEDLNTLPDQYFKKLRDTYPITPILYIEPIWRHNELDEKPCGYRFSEARKLLGTIASRYGILVIDDYHLVPHDLSYFMEDGLHPSDKGFLEYGRHMIAHLEKLL